MARPRGPLANAPRDLTDDFVGVPAEEIKTGAPMRWPPKPKKVKGNNFHSKVEGRTSPTRADRKSGLSAGGGGYYRRGGWVSGYARGGDTTPADAMFDAKGKQTPNFKKGGVLSAKQRQAMPSSEFALPGKGKGPKGAGAGSYPIPDEGHAKSALSRIEQHGSSAEKATVRRKVKAKFPGMNVKG